MAMCSAGHSILLRSVLGFGGRSRMSECTHCAGTGVMQGPLEIDCAACQGSGVIIAGTCPACDGRGAKTITTDVLCNQCGGSGLVRRSGVES
jgi:DnaJ-class molecular chaperone